MGRVDDSGFEVTLVGSSYYLYGRTFDSIVIGAIAPVPGVPGYSTAVASLRLGFRAVAGLLVWFGVGIGFGATAIGSIATSPDPAAIGSAILVIVVCLGMLWASRLVARARARALVGRLGDVLAGAEGIRPERVVG